MDLKILTQTNSLNGEIKPPGSKSYSHRAFILAGLAPGVSILKNPLISGDVEVTIDILKKLGVKILSQSNEIYLITGKEKFSEMESSSLDCKNSGTSARIFSALSLLIKGGLSLKGVFFKKNRPIKPLLEALKNLGAQYSFEDEILSIERTDSICNPIQIRGDISSQLLTALLILSPLIQCEKKGFIEIELTTEIVSYPYIQITLEILKDFGINISERVGSDGLLNYIIATSQKVRTQEYEIPADFSSASFLIAAAVLSPGNSEILIKNLDFQNPQGDKKFIEILKEMGAHIEINPEEKSVSVYGNIYKNPLKGISIDCSNIPDLFPILSVIGAFASGETKLYNAENLRVKESDRISGMAEELEKMGVKLEELEDGLIVYHTKNISGATINHRNDHRIAMACTIAGLYASTESRINNIEVVKDSYPHFIEDLKSLGANIQKIS
ncbi:MAG: 3-phosphoshikimate 1-carboxyvinyltransferase [Promethearchaeota archaeon]|nr:MAG: 3-phosphoshikimate 1-carboxyvinyltransferase [Candidatus Lokiarchaeota archaeon]